MSMILKLAALNPRQVADIERDPAKADRFTAPLDHGDLPPNLRNAPAELREGYLQARRQMAALFPGHKAAPSSAGEAPAKPPLSLDKAWHVIHFLLSGHADIGGSYADSLLAGSPVGDNTGYGPARLLDADHVQRFARALAPLDGPCLADRFDAPRMTAAGVYPLNGTLSPEDIASWRAEIADRFPDLKAYVSDSSSDGYGLLIWIE